jgi:hypothetical protein
MKNGKLLFLITEQVTRQIVGASTLRMRSLSIECRFAEEPYYELVSKKSQLGTGQFRTIRQIVRDSENMTTQQNPC